MDAGNRSKAALEEQSLQLDAVETTYERNSGLKLPGSGNNLPDATRIRRKRGPSLSRRKGQNGSVFQHSEPWNPRASAYGRYWVDVPGCVERKRRTVSLGVCASRTDAKKKLRDHIDREGINSNATFASATAPAMTFKAQAEKWIASLPTRRRKPVKPATIDGWRHSLKKWVLPSIGDKLLADVGNATLRAFIDKMASAGLSAQSIVTHAKVVKMVVASALNAEGDQLYPRKWNDDFVGMPIINRTEQSRPTVTAVEIVARLESTKGKYAVRKRKYAVLFALLAGSGLRIGEALGLKTSDLSAGCCVLSVRRSIYRGQEQQPKTPSAVRDVDIARPLAQLLQEYVQGKSGYLFSTKDGLPIQQRNALRALHHAGKPVGFHAFRRFRAEILRRALVPEALIGFWLGHANKTITDFYAQGLKRDLAWRKEWCDRAGLGFSLDGLLGLQNVVSIQKENAA